MAAAKPAPAMQPPSSEDSPPQMPVVAQASDAVQNPILHDALASLDLVDGDDATAGGGSCSKTAPRKKKPKSRSKDPNFMWTRPTSRKRKKKATAPQAKPSSVVIIGADSEECAPGQPVLLSRVFRSLSVDLSVDRLAAASSKGYRMVRATHGVAAGAWYFEVKVLYLGATGHARLGWVTGTAEIDAPVGFDAYGFGYRDIDGAKVHKAWRDRYAADGGYGERDVLGFYISLPDGEKYKPELTLSSKGKPVVLVQAHSNKQDATVPHHVPGSGISYFKNGVCQGIAFKDIPGGRYYPAASLYTLPEEPKCVVKFNFGPHFKFFPQDFGSGISYFKNGVCQCIAFKDIPGGRYYPAASLYTLPKEPKCVVKFNFEPLRVFPTRFWWAANPTTNEPGASSCNDGEE